MKDQEQLLAPKYKHKYYKLTKSGEINLNDLKDNIPIQLDIKNKKMCLIEFRFGDMFYIASTNNFKNYVSKMMTELIIFTKRCHSPELVECFEQYGVENTTIRIIETIEDNNLKTLLNKKREVITEYRINHPDKMINKLYELD
jgi:hypothetical protein